MSASVSIERAARLAMAINDISPNSSIDLAVHGLGVDVNGRLVSPTAGYRTHFPLTWSDLDRNPEVLTAVVLSTALGLARTETRFERVTEMKPQAAKALRRCPETIITPECVIAPLFSAVMLLWTGHKLLGAGFTLLAIVAAIYLWWRR